MPGIWGKGQYWEKERKEHKEIFSSSKNRAEHLKNITGMCMLQPAGMKRIKKKKRKKGEALEIMNEKSDFQAELRHAS